VAETPQPVADLPAARPEATPGAGSPAPATPPPQAVPERPPRPAPAPVFGSRGLYDRSNPDFGLLQPAREALSGFPVDSLGRVNWVRALADGLITPRRAVQPGGTMRSLDTAIVMRNTRAMPYVRFPHLQHTQWLDCSNCHPKPFKPQVGANNLAMDEILSGRACGLCHSSVAFSVMTCERCHSIPHAGSPEKWW